MPIMDGFGTTRKVIEACQLNNFPAPSIIALTANEPTTELLAKCKNSGMEDLMTKPPGFAHLMDLFARKNVDVEVADE